MAGKRRSPWFSLVTILVFIGFAAFRLLGHDAIFHDLHLVPPALYGVLDIVLWIMFGGLVLYSFLIGDPKVMSGGSIGNYGAVPLAGLTLAIPAAVLVIVLIMDFGSLPPTVQQYMRMHAMLLSLAALGITVVAWLFDTLRRKIPSLLLVRLAAILFIGGGIVLFSILHQRAQGATPSMLVWLWPGLDVTVTYVWTAIAAVIASLFIDGRPSSGTSPGQA